MGWLVHWLESDRGASRGPSRHPAESGKKDRDWTNGLQKTGGGPLARALRRALRDPCRRSSHLIGRDGLGCCIQELEHPPIRTPQDVMSPTTCIDQLCGRQDRDYQSRYKVSSLPRDKRTARSSLSFSLSYYILYYLLHFASLLPKSRKDVRPIRAAAKCCCFLHVCWNYPILRYVPR